MSVSEQDPRLTAYALGELNSDELREFEVLLQSDATARAEVAAIRQTSSQLEREFAPPNGPALSVRRRTSILAAVLPSGAVPRGTVSLPAAPLSRNTARAKRHRLWVLLAALVPFAVALYGTGLPVGVAHSIWRIIDMPTSPLEVTLSGAPLSEAPLPVPPPPSPPPKRASTHQKAKPVDPAAEPTRSDERISSPSVVEEPSRESDSVMGGDTAGDDVSVVGGMVGVVGASVPPRPKSTGPKFVSAREGHGLLAINPNVAPYKVNVPEELLQRGEVYSSTLNICVTEQGTVSSVKLLRPSTPMIDLQIPSVVPKWRYHPYLRDGKPTAFCYDTKYTVR